MRILRLGSRPQKTRDSGTNSEVPIAQNLQGHRRLSGLDLTAMREVLRNNGVGDSSDAQFPVSCQEPRAVGETTTI